MNNPRYSTNFNGSPLVGTMPHTECEEMENPIFLTHAEAGALFNAIGFCVTTIKASHMVVQEPTIQVLADEELNVYSTLRKKLYNHLNQV